MFIFVKCSTNLDMEARQQNDFASSWWVSPVASMLDARAAKVAVDDYSISY